MADYSILTEKVRDRITAIDSNHHNSIFEPAVIDAMRLADMFASVEPQEYILPLDEMFGFPVAAKSNV
jgi:hypothetical protein